MSQKRKQLQNFWTNQCWRNSVGIERRDSRSYRLSAIARFSVITLLTAIILFQDWQEIVKLYEKENLHLAELSSRLLRNLNYEIPAIKRQIAKCGQVREVCRQEFVISLAKYFKLTCVSCRM